MVKKLDAIKIYGIAESGNTEHQWKESQEMSFPGRRSLLDSVATIAICDNYILILTTVHVIQLITVLFKH